MHNTTNNIYVDRFIRNNHNLNWRSRPELNVLQLIVDKKVKTRNIILALYYGIENHTKKVSKSSLGLQLKVNGGNLILLSKRYEKHMWVA